MDIFFLIIALIGLWLGSELVIKGALNISRHYKISELLVGLTVVAVGTSLPEMVITITASVQRLGGTETSGLIIGQSIGSSMSQAILMLGVIGMISLVTISKRELWRDGIMLIISVILLMVLCVDGILSRVDAGILLIIYLIYLASILREEKLKKKFKLATKIDFFWSFVYLLGGFALLVFSSDLTIKNALSISHRWGLAQSFVGILIVGVGTSLPELVTATAAVRKKAGQLAVGNLIGSTIFVLLFVLGIGGVISNFLFDKNLLRFDMIVLLCACVIAVVLLGTSRKLFRKEAVVLIGMYVIYFVAKIWSGV